MAGLGLDIRLGGGGGAGTPLGASFAKFVSFDGTSTFVRWSAGPSTVVDGRRGTFVVPFNRKGGTGAECILYVGTTTGESVFIGFDSTNHLVCRISDGAVAPTAILTITSTTTYSDSVNRVAMFSYDLDTIGGTARYWQFVNDTNVGGVPTTGTAADIDLTDVWRIGSTEDSASRQWYSGACGNILFYPDVFDLSDATYRRYFYGAVSDGPVNHGASGNAVLSAQPPLYWVAPASNVVANSGSGGDADSASSFSDAASPPNLALPPTTTFRTAALFNVPTDQGIFIGNPGITGMTDSGLFTIFFRYKLVTLPSVVGEHQCIFGMNSGSVFTASATFAVYIDSADDKVKLIGHGTGTTVCVSNVAETLDGKWHTMMIKVNCDIAGGGASAVAQMYRDRVDVQDAVSTTFQTVNSDLTRPTSIGDFSFAGTLDRYAGHLCDLWFDPVQDIDFSVAETRDKFDKDGRAVSLGATGSVPTGTAPVIYWPGDASAATTNAGSGGNFTTNSLGTDLIASPQGPKAP